LILVAGPGDAPDFTEAYETASDIWPDAREKLWTPKYWEPLVIYTTNAIESVNARLRKILKTRGHFPSDDAATKLIWLALRKITKDWARASPTGRQP
jgi:transposase-like protein